MHDGRQFAVLAKTHSEALKGAPWLPRSEARDALTHNNAEFVLPDDRGVVSVCIDGDLLDGGIREQAHDPLRDALLELVTEPCAYLRARKDSACAGHATRKPRQRLALPPLPCFSILFPRHCSIECPPCKSRPSAQTGRLVIECRNQLGHCPKRKHTMQRW